MPPIALADGEKVDALGLPFRLRIEIFKRGGWMDPPIGDGRDSSDSLRLAPNDRDVLQQKYGINKSFWNSLRPGGVGRNGRRSPALGCPSANQISLAALKSDSPSYHGWKFLCGISPLRWSRISEVIRCFTWKRNVFQVRVCSAESNRVMVPQLSVKMGGS